MAEIQCKMCGGTLDIPKGMTTGVCPYCGRMATLSENLNERNEHKAEDSVFPAPRPIEPYVPAFPSSPSSLQRSRKESAVHWQLNDEDTRNMPKRIPLLILQGEWDKARNYCEKVLETDPENPEIYLYLCMIDLQVSTEDELRKAPSLEDDKNFRVAMHLASPERKKQLEDIQTDSQRAITREEQRIGKKTDHILLIISIIVLLIVLVITLATYRDL